MNDTHKALRTHSAWYKASRLCFLLLSIQQTFAEGLSFTRQHVRCWAEAAADVSSTLGTTPAPSCVLIDGCGTGSSKVSLWIKPNSAGVLLSSLVPET